MAALDEASDGRICIPSPHGAGRGVTVMIDNYDSFTYNVVQYLVECGANLVIFRNDKVSLETIEALHPDNLVISPGPGHPTTDAGISTACIERFQGRIPILGICMGLQCIVVANGGKVESAGEIFHGKVSSIRHDGQGLFADMPSSHVTGTRYHSLSAEIVSMPDCLEATSWTDSQVIMGVRHKTYTVEAVQYHPESVMSEHGRQMMKNFLSWRGRTWAENGVGANKAPAAASTSSETILQRIYRQRRLDVDAAQKVPGHSLAELEASIALQVDPPSVCFPTRLLQGTTPGAPGVMAEIKRASPSKGDIAIHTHAGEQALAYARGGAHVISVLTEPTWFKGTLDDLALVRRAVERLPQRPAILRKDFILDEYQIAEARLAGADTVLLIVAMLDDATLRRLYEYSVRLHMEPLVEVNNAEEMQRALALNPKVIGVNNRNLHSFEVDMGTTTRLAQAALERGVILVALSGISGRADVEAFLEHGVQAVLVGEALMRAQDKSAFVAELQGRAPPPPLRLRRLVKVCGIKTPEAAETAVRAGADMVGMILAPGTRRTVSMTDAAAIVARVRQTPRAPVSATPSFSAGDTWFAWHARRLAAAAAERTLVVGVFRDQTLEEIAETTARLGLDVVQLHGRAEPLDWTRYLPGVFVIRVFSVAPGTRSRVGQRALQEATRPGFHHAILLDTAAASGDGGSGQSFDWAYAQDIATSDAPQPFLLAGGLTPHNVQDALGASHAWGVDTSSGIETNGTKDTHKIQQFVDNARSAP